MIKRKFYGEKGVTLIALIITIIVLLILAGIAINALSGDNALITKTKDAAEEWRVAEVDEEEVLNEIYAEIQKVSEEANLSTIASKVNNDNTGEIKIGDYVNYTPTPVVALVNESPIVETVRTYSGAPSSSNSAEGTGGIKQVQGTKWRVLDKTANGEVRLISDVPVSRVALKGAKGYNNLVKVIDDVCKGLYDNKNFTSDVKNVKIEDIEEKMSVVPEVSSTSIVSSGKYPKIWEQEIDAIINGVTQSGTLTRSKQENYISEESVTITTPITIKNTYWAKNFGASNNGQFKKDIYYSLFIKKENGTYYDYWLSSRCIATGSSANFREIHIDYEGRLSAYSLCGIDDYPEERVNGLRPVITLKSNVKVVDGNGTTGWNIK